MCGWGQAKDHDPGRRVAKPGDRPTPVRFVAKRCALLGSYQLTPLDQPGAGPAVHDVTSETFNRIHSRSRYGQRLRHVMVKVEHDCEANRTNHRHRSNAGG